MKIKNYWLVFGAILVFVVLVLCAFSQTQESASQTKEDILKLIPHEWLKKYPCSMEKLADKIIKDNEDLAKLFEKGTLADLKALIELHAQINGTIVDEGYNVVSSKDKESIIKFWNKARTKGSKLKFKTVNIYLTDQLGKQPGKIFEGKISKEVIFDAFAHVIQEFTIVTPGAGVSTYDPGEGRDYAHQEECTWGGGGRG